MKGDKLTLPVLRSATQAWHNALVAEKGDPREGNRGMVAELRRASSIGEVMLTQAFGRLVARAMRYAELDETPPKYTLEMLARTAMVLAHAKACDETAPSLGVIMGKLLGGRPVVSPVRAKVLFRSPDADDAAARLLPILALIEARLRAERTTLVLDPKDVLTAMGNWQRGRVRWAMDYHASGPTPDSMPATVSATSPTTSRKEGTTA